MSVLLYLFNVLSFILELGYFQAVETQAHGYEISLDAY